MKTRLWIALALPLLWSVGPGHTEDEQAEREKKADEAAAEAIDKLRAIPDAETREERVKLSREVGDLFARACGLDIEVDVRFFKRFDEREEGEDKTLRAVLYSQFARGYCAGKHWRKALGNIDRAIDLETSMTRHFRRLKDEILRRKREAEREG